MQKETEEKKGYKLIKKIIWIIFYALAAIIIFILITQKLSNNSISVAGYRIFRIASESMVPKYEVGDVILIKETPFEEISTGSDLVYIANTENIQGIPITHTLIKKQKDEDGHYKFYTQGIANINMDPIVNEEQVLGIVQYKFNILSFLCKTVNQLYGAILLIFIPLILIILVEVRELIINIKAEKKQKKQ